MEKALKFLMDCGVFYLATVEGDQPHVRPFGAVCGFEGKQYFITNNKKKVFNNKKNINIIKNNNNNNNINNNKINKT